MDDHYRIRVRSGDLEIEISSHDKSFVEEKLKEYEKKQLQPSASAPGKQKTREPSTPSSKRLSMQEFVRRTTVRTATERVLAATYFKEKYEHAEEISRTDIIAAFKVMKYTCANPSDAIAKAKKKAWLMDGIEKGSFVTTHTGEEWIEARLEANEE